MPRVQHALSLSDLQASIDISATALATAPHKLRLGYANFIIDSLPLKLMVIQQSD